MLRYALYIVFVKWAGFHSLPRIWGFSVDETLEKI